MSESKRPPRASAGPSTPDRPLQQHTTHNTNNKHSNCSSPCLLQSSSSSTKGPPGAPKGERAPRELALWLMGDPLKNKS